MAVRKLQDVLRINIAQTDPQQLEVVRYLRNSGQITSQSMEAIRAYWYSYALGLNRTASDAAVELAASESVLALSGQIRRVLNFHRIDRGIVLPNEFLGQCGLTWESPRSLISQQSTATPKSSVFQKIDSSAFEQEDDEEDDEDDDIVEAKRGTSTGVKIAGMNVSQSVADFLNGTNGR